MYPGTPPVFAMHSRKNIRREPMGYLMIDVLVQHCRLFTVLLEMLKNNPSGFRMKQQGL